MARNPTAAEDRPLRFAVPASARKVATVKVEAGETWRFSATGRWRDAAIPCGPDGYRCFPWDVLEIFPRVPDENWFCLIGMIEGRPDSVFAIGSGGEHEFKDGGDLIVFANDQLSRYNNNHGCVDLVMERVGEPASSDGKCPAT